MTFYMFYMLGCSTYQGVLRASIFHKLFLETVSIHTLVLVNIVLMSLLSLEKVTAMIYMVE